MTGNQQLLRFTVLVYAVQLTDIRAFIKYLSPVYRTFIELKKNRISRLKLNFLLKKNVFMGELIAYTYNACLASRFIYLPVFVILLFIWYYVIEVNVILLQRF